MEANRVTRKKHATSVGNNSPRAPNPTKYKPTLGGGGGGTHAFRVARQSQHVAVAVHEHLEITAGVSGAQRRGGYRGIRRQTGDRGMQVIVTAGQPAPDRPRPDVFAGDRRTAADGQQLHQHVRRPAAHLNAVVAHVFQRREPAVVHELGRGTGRVHVLDVRFERPVHHQQPVERDRRPYDRLQPPQTHRGCV